MAPVAVKADKFNDPLNVSMNLNKNIKNNSIKQYIAPVVFFLVLFSEISFRLRIVIDKTTDEMPFILSIEPKRYVFRVRN